MLFPVLGPAVSLKQKTNETFRGDNGLASNGLASFGDRKLLRRRFALDGQNRSHEARAQPQHKPLHGEASSGELRWGGRSAPSVA